VGKMTPVSVLQTSAAFIPLRFYAWD
jgi:hypothetical protein